MVEGELRRPTRAGLGKKVAIPLIVLFLLAAVALTIPYFGGGHPVEPPPVATSLRTQGLSPDEGAWHEQLVESADAREVAASLFDEQPAIEAVRFLSYFLQDQIALGQLTITHPQSQRRPPLSVSTLTDGVLASIFARDGAYLSSTELTMLIAALAHQAGHAHDVVVLAPPEPTFWNRPVVAVRFLATDGQWAVNPRTGALQRAEKLPGHGAEMLWAFYQLEMARFFVRSGRASEARGPLERAVTLAPSLWLARAMAAEAALEQGDVAAARASARHLGSETDHPFGWYVEAAAETGPLTSPQAREGIRTALTKIVESFPEESVLAVELARLHVDADEYQEARRWFEEALRRNPSVRRAHTGLGDLYVRSDTRRALEHARAELALHPDEPEAYACIAVIHAYRGEEADVVRAVDAGASVADDPAEFRADLEPRLAWAREARADDAQRLGLSRGR